MNRKGLHIYVVVLTLVLLGSIKGSVYAQVAGTVAPDKSALEMAFQNRAKWSGLKYNELPTLLERSFFDVSAGYEDLFEKTSSTAMGQGYSLGLSYGVWLAPVHGLELGYNCLNFNEKGNGVSSLDLNYLFNMTSFASKLDRPNKWELWLKAGVIAKFVPDNISYGASAGMRGAYNFTNTVGLFVEPSVILYDKNADGVYTGQTRGNVSVSVMAGLSFQLDPIVRGIDNFLVAPLMAWGSESNQNQILLQRDSLSLGDSANWSGLRFTNGSNFWNRVYLNLGYGYEDMFEKTSTTKYVQGYTMRVALGSWLTPIHGLEFGYNYNLTNSSESAYSSIDLNYQFNVTSYAARVEMPKRWELILKAGLDAKLRGENTSFGVSGAMRGQYNINRTLGVFVEPKISLLGKDADGVYTGQTRGNVSVTTTAGLSLKLNPVGNKVLGLAALNNFYQYRDSIDLSNKKLSKLARFYIDLGYGYEDLMEKTSPNYMIQGKTLRLGIGSWITPIHGVELGYNYNFTQSSEYAYSSIDLNYQFNLTSYALGLDAPNRWELILKAGVGAKLRSDNTSFGVSGGMRGQYNITKMLGVFIEPKISLLGKDGDGVYTGQTRGNVSVTTTAGLSLKLKSDRSNSIEIAALNDYYLRGDSIDFSAREISKFNKILSRTNLDLGYGYEDLMEKTSPNYMIQGKTLRLGVGSWITPIHGVELGYNYNFTQSSEYAYSSIDLNYQFNLTSYALGLDAPNRWELILKAGVGAKLRSDNTSFGVSGGMRGQYNITRTLGIFIEPKISLLGKDGDGVYTGQTRGNVSVTTTAGIALRLAPVFSF